MSRLDMIKSKTRRRRVISVVINVRNVAIVIYSQLCGLQMSKRVGEVTGISAKGGKQA